MCTRHRFAIENITNNFIVNIIKWAFIVFIIFQAFHLEKKHFMISVLGNTKMIKSSWKPVCGPLSLNFYNAFLWRRSLLSLTLMGYNIENLSFFFEEYLYFVMRINDTNLIFSFTIFIEEIYIFNKNERFYSFLKTINNLFLYLISIMYKVQHYFNFNC